MKKLVLACLVIILFTTCKKKLFYKVELSGRVLDECTSNPIAGVKVYFLGGNVGLSSSGPGYYQKTSVTTGSDGSFKFTFNVNDNDAYALLPEYDKTIYFSDKNAGRPIEINLKKKLFKEKITQDIYLNKYSILNVRFKQIITDTVLVFSLSANNSSDIFKWTTGNGDLWPAYMADFTIQYLYYGADIGSFRFLGTLKSNPNNSYMDTIYKIQISKTEPTNFQINY